MNFRSPAELFNAQEDLHEDLVPYVEKVAGFTALRHPLVFGVPYTKQMNAMYNEQYKCKQIYIEESKKKKDWSKYIWLHERPYRLVAFVNIIENLTDRQYWSILGQIWVDTENQWQFKNIFASLMINPRQGRKYLMDEEDHKLFDLLPEEFVIYRGYSPRKNKFGFSWSLSY